MDVNQQEFINETKFSVSMCVYKNDNPEHFHKAVESIINQSVKPHEIVLVVDGPIPPSIDYIIKLYEKESFFKVIRLSKNVGHGNARRTGLANCKYELVALMDADDISLPDRFEKQIRCFKEDDSLSIVGGNIEEFIDRTDNVVGIRVVPQEDVDIKKYLKKRCPFNQVTVMLKNSEVKNVGGYKDWYQNEDYYLWIRMFLRGAKFKNLEDSLVMVRVGNKMYQRRGGVKYFNSEVKLQTYMLKNKVIGLPLYFVNVSKRLIVQILLPNKIRGWVFQKFAREEKRNGGKGKRV